MALIVTTVALVGIGGGIALANRDDMSTQVSASGSQLAMLNQACSDWLNHDPQRPHPQPGVTT